jgi:hypothetical protein
MDITLHIDDADGTMTVEANGQETPVKDINQALDAIKGYAAEAASNADVGIPAGTDDTGPDQMQKAEEQGMMQGYKGARSRG